MTALNIEEITNYLPHRYPFLLVDKVLKMEHAQSVTAIKNVSISDPVFMGHFPGRPIMPGVLIIEALAQAAGVLAYHSTNWDPSETVFYLGAVDKARFKRVVIPGDQLQLQVDVKNKRPSAWKFIGKATVDGVIACSAEITCLEGKFGDK